MKKQKIIIRCALCNELIAKTFNLSVSIEDVAKEKQLAEIIIKNKEESRKSFLCNVCYNMLKISKEPLRKEVKNVSKFGNGCHVTISKEQLNKKVVLFYL